MSFLINAGLIAFFSSFFFACYTVTLGKALIKSPPWTGVLMTVIVSASIFWFVYILSSGISIEDFYALRYFIMAGFFYPVIFRFFYFRGIETVGPSITGAVSGASPAISAIPAILLLKEVMTLEIGLGLVSIVLGIVLLHLRSVKLEKNSRKKKHMVFPLAAVMISGLAAVAIKKGLEIVPSPFLGTAVTQSTSLLVLCLLFSSSEKVRKDMRLKTSKNALLVLGGIFIALAWLLRFTALNLGRIIVVEPIVFTYPLFTIALSNVFLKRSEGINFSLITGTGLIVVGAALIQLS